MPGSVELGDSELGQVKIIMPLSLKGRRRWRQKRVTMLVAMVRLVDIFEYTEELVVTVALVVDAELSAGTGHSFCFQRWNRLSEGRWLLKGWNYDWRACRMMGGWIFGYMADTWILNARVILIC